MPVRVRGRGDARADAELTEDVGDVAMHRVLADHQASRDLAVGQASASSRSTSSSRAQPRLGLRNASVRTRLVETRQQPAATSKACPAPSCANVACAGLRLLSRGGRFPRACEGACQVEPGVRGLERQPAAREEIDGVLEVTARGSQVASSARERSAAPPARARSESVGAAAAMDAAPERGSAASGLLAARARTSTSSPSAPGAVAGRCLAQELLRRACTRARSPRASASAAQSRKRVAPAFYLREQLGRLGEAALAAAQLGEPGGRLARHPRPDLANSRAARASSASASSQRPHEIRTPA